MRSVVDERGASNLPYHDASSLSIPLPYEPSSWRRETRPYCVCVCVCGIMRGVCVFGRPRKTVDYRVRYNNHRSVAVTSYDHRWSSFSLISFMRPWACGVVPNQIPSWIAEFRSQNCRGDVSFLPVKASTPSSVINKVCSN